MAAVAPVVFPRRQIVALVPGPAEVKGRVLMLGSLIPAPLSGRFCVYYQVSGSNHTWPWHSRLSYPPGEVRFRIDDGSGVVIVVVRPPIECSIAGEGVRRTIYAGESPHLDHLLTPGGSFAPDAYLNAEERIIAAKATLTVGGHVVREVAPDGESVNYRTPPTRLVLQARSIHQTPG